jgi:hypothetical protein
MAFGRDAKTGKYDPRVPSGGADLVSWANSRKDEARKMPEREAYLNISFVLGQQWVTWDQTKRRLDSPRAQRGDPNAPVRITVNKMGGLVERTISKLTKSAPVPECRPVTDEERDLSAAKVGTRILQSEMNRLQWETLLTRLYFWVMPLGWSFMHVYWDTYSGPQVDASVLPEADRPDEPLNQGNVCLEIVPGTEVRIDPNAAAWSEVRYLTRTTNMTRAAIYELYGVTDVSGDVSGMRDVADDIFSLQDGTAWDAERRSQKAKVEQVAVHQLWLRPHGRAKPEGLVLTWCGDTILEGPAPFPYDHGQLPFVPFSLLPGLGRPEGRTWVTDLRGMQQDYNDARSREATIRRTLVPKIMAARGQIDPQRLTSRVEVVEYAPTGERPTWEIPNGQWMAQFESAMGRADMEMGDRAGQAEVSQGRAPAGAPAAAILALQEADESKLAISAKELAAATESVGWQLLMLVRQFWTEERMIRTWSQDGKIEVTRFRGADLPNQLDVQVSAESMLPKSKSARAQLALDLWDRQILRDPSQFIRMVEIPGVGFLQEDFDRDVRQAEREYGRMVTGELVAGRGLAQPLGPHQPAQQRPQDRGVGGHRGQGARRGPGGRARWWPRSRSTTSSTTSGWPTSSPASCRPTSQAARPARSARARSGGADMPGGAGPHYLDPMTGMPPDPLAVAVRPGSVGPQHEPAERHHAHWRPRPDGPRPGPVGRQPGRRNRQLSPGGNRGPRRDRRSRRARRRGRTVR